MRIIVYKHFYLLAIAMIKCGIPVVRGYAVNAKTDKISGQFDCWDAGYCTETLKKRIYMGIIT